MSCMLCQKHDRVSYGPNVLFNLSWKDWCLGILDQLHPTSCIHSNLISRSWIALNSRSSPSEFCIVLFRLIHPSRRHSSSIGPIGSPKYGTSSSSSLSVLQSVLARGACDCCSGPLLGLVGVLATRHPLVEGDGGLTRARDFRVHLVVVQSVVLRKML
jgi:hypothetical protein